MRFQSHIIKFLLLFVICISMIPDILAKGYTNDNQEDNYNNKDISLIYDLDFEYYFDNREFDAGKELFTPSMTINAARLTPFIGIKIYPTDKIRHNIMIGCDIVKNMGENSRINNSLFSDKLVIFKEMTLYYASYINVNESTKVRGYAGVFPRNLRFRKEEKAFISDSLKFYDNNIEGVLIQAERPNSIYEIGCDWMGMIGSERRERFMLFFYGKTNISSWLSTGINTQMYHMANTREYRGVIDNFLLSPFVVLNLYETRNTLVSTNLSWLQGIQRDRIQNSSFIFPCGLKTEIKALYKKIGLNSSTYVGKNLMPYYDRSGGGNKYGTDLYWGDPFFQVYINKQFTNRTGVYNMTELFYQPHLTNLVDVRISLSLHFAPSYSGKFAFMGSQQQFSLIFNLNKLKNKRLQIEK